MRPLVQVHVESIPHVSDVPLDHSLEGSFVSGTSSNVPEPTPHPFLDEGLVCLPDRRWDCKLKWNHSEASNYAPSEKHRELGSGGCSGDRLFCILALECSQIVE